MSDETIPLKDLTTLGVFSQKLSEIHFNNLKTFPWIFFNGLTSAKLDYNIASRKEEESWVSYDLTLNKENDLLDKRFAHLETAIRSLFWKEVALKVYINGEEVYKSE